MVAGRPYQLVLAPVRAPEVIAWVAMGFVINDKLAADMAHLVGVEVSFVGTAAGAPTFLASSMDAAQRSKLNHGGTARTDHIFVVGRQTMNISASQPADSAVRCRWCSTARSSRPCGLMRSCVFRSS